MESVVQSIRIKGAEVRLLITPALFSIAKRKGLALTVEDKNDTADVLDLYLKIIWLAAINYDEAARLDEPERIEFPYRYIDFARWSYENQNEFAKMVLVVVDVLKGKANAEMSSGEEKKK